MADATGGQYYDARTVLDIVPIYNQLATLLLNQYVLTWDSSIEAGASGELFIRAVSGMVKGEDLKGITPCPVP